MAPDDQRAHLLQGTGWKRCALSVVFFTLPVAAQSARDSTGVRIVENVRPLWAPRERVTLGATPFLVIGDTTSDPYRFRRVRGVMRLSDGRLAVADGGSLQLRFYTPSGQYLSATGGPGSAPGKLRSMETAYRLRGDTIAIQSGLAGVSLFASSGEFVPTVGTPRGTTRPTRLAVLGMLSDGRSVVAPLPLPQTRPIGQRWADSLELQLLDRSGEVAKSLGRHAYMEFEQQPRGPVPPWLSAIGAFAGGEERFYVGFGDRFEIRVFDGSGALRSIIRRTWTPEPITVEDWEEWVVEGSKLWVKEQGVARDSVVDAVRRAPYAATLPAFSQYLVVRTGRLWVRGARWQDAVGAGSYTDMPVVPSRWSVFDPDGRWLGDVEMPPYFMPREIGADYVAGEMWTRGMTRVAVYALERGREP